MTIERPLIAAYYFPGWHVDEKNAQRHGEGWTEWQLLQNAEPRFDGHRQPRIPANGYVDESTPEAMEHEIDLAADHGVDCFLFDYYWHEDGPFLAGALDDGFLRAANSERMTFALMWANHDWFDLFPAPAAGAELVTHGPISRRAFDEMTTHIVNAYFSRSEYLKIDGRPFFSIYEVGSLIEGLGGVAEARAALEDFERKAVAAGHAGIHFDAVMWGFHVLPTTVEERDPAGLIEQLNIASASSYAWIHHTDVTRSSFPVGDWDIAADDAVAAYQRYKAELDIPFVSNVTVGWDSSPRTDKDDDFAAGGYPWYPVYDATPDQFRTALERVSALADPRLPMLVINAWNEWTEGSALLPDTTHGAAFLEAIRGVFGVRPDAAREAVPL